MKKVLILGGGFAGVQTAIELQKSKNFDVTLVSDRDFLFVYPISIWIPVHELTYENAQIKLADIQIKHGFKLIIDKVIRINAAENTVTFEKQLLSYNYLIVAFGSGKMQPKGVEHTSTICGQPLQTKQFREKLDDLVTKGNGKIAIGFGGNPKDKSAVRGGPAFELMFNINHYLKKKGIRKNFQLTMFAPMTEPGARMGKNALKAMSKMFASQNIKSHYGKKITEFVEDGIIFEDNSKLESDLTMFIAAGAGSPLLKNSDLPLSDAGFVKINDYNQVEEFPNVFAIGDAAAYEGPEWKAKQGHIAEVMGRNAAYNIIQIENGSDKRKGYQAHLNILCVMDMGDGAAFVYRDRKREILIPMPVVGHWLKQAWGKYARMTKVGKFPRLPNM
ncbi:MAG: sulfide:quinone reductase [Porphyromonadaceae bacterium CG2_30_38_12]|nr:MAG: sulfide:quinone reductase [Porphyromonadaceae bacterium CG2_30_38_12]